MREGKQKGEITPDRSSHDLARTYAGLQRGMVYSWLLESCRYSLMDSEQAMMKLFLDSIRA